MKAGDLILFKKEFCNPGEENKVFRITEWNGDRGLIEPAETDLHIVPTELVRYFQIETKEVKK